MDLNQFIQIFNQMKYILVIILLFIAQIHGQSTNKTPNKIDTDVVASASKPKFSVTEYFSLEGMNAEIGTKERYAFILVKAPQKKFWIKYHVYLSTADKTTGARSGTKAECEGTHNELHYCFLSHKRIDYKRENLVVEIVFQEDALFEMRVEINTAHSIQLGETVPIRHGDANFSRIFRLDVSKIRDSFDYLQLQFGEMFSVDEYSNAMTFIVSYEQMPPDSYRKAAESIPVWSDRQVILLTFQEMQQVQVLTILFGVNDRNTYVFSSKLITSLAPRQQIFPERVIYEIAEHSRSYTIDLPKRNESKYYLLHLTLESLLDFNLTDVRVNGGRKLSQQQVLLFLVKEGSTKTANQLDIWLNSTITSFEFTLNLASLSIYSIQLTQFDIQLITLRQNILWNEKIFYNQTEWLYFVIDTRNSDQAVNFEVQAAIPLTGCRITFHNCVEKDVAQCHKAATSKNQTQKSIALPVLSPTKQPIGLITYYTFSNYSITKHEITPYQYRSIVAVQVKAEASAISYELRWHLVTPLAILRENQLVRGKLEPGETKVFSFSRVDASALPFARVHFIHGTSASYIFGASVLINVQRIKSNEQLTGIVNEFDGSLTFTKLKNRTTYYVYIMAQVRDYFQLTLTYGYNIDEQLYHPISYLTLGEHSSNRLVLEPQEVLFLQIRSKVSGVLTVTNTVPLKICEFLTSTPPKTHKDMTDCPYCQTYSTVNHFFTVNYNHSNKFFIGIENQNTTPADLQLQTDNTLLECVPQRLGKTMFLFFNNTNSTERRKLCVHYQISQKGELQILVDINNPKLQGIALPQVKIGKWQSVMSTNLLVISADDLDAYCENQYEECRLIVEIQADEQHRVDQKLVAVTAAYTNQPLPLKDGLAVHSSVKPGVPRHFKYPIYTHQNITATIQNLEYKSIRLYARIITISEKFNYPTPEESLDKDDGVYASVPHTVYYPITLIIPSKQLISKCQNPDRPCYALFSIYSDENNTLASNFVMQVTQSVSTLIAEARLQKYLQKDSKAYFNYRNTQPNSTLLFYTSSNTKDCVMLEVFNGNKGANSLNAIASGLQEVLVSNSTADWYTISVKARQNCYFTIQAATTRKSVRELVLGFANYFSLTAGEKRYYLVHNKGLDQVKMIASLSQKTSGQVTLQAMPVPDESLGEFISFINGDGELAKRSKLAFVWSDVNHLTIRSSDSKYCRDCFICFEAQSTQHVEGYLTLPSKKQHYLFKANYISYDILLANQSFSWLANAEINSYDFFVAIQAGELKISVQDLRGKQSWGKISKYDKTDPSKNLLNIDMIKVESSDHVSIKIEAVGFAVYSIYTLKKNDGEINRKPKNKFVQVGRANFLYTRAYQDCFDGQLAPFGNQFFVTADNEQASYAMKNSLTTKLTIAGKQVKLHRQLSPNALTLTVDSASLILNSEFTICFSLSDTSKPFVGSLYYLGSLKSPNYIAQNTVLHVKNSMDLTFMSQGKGVIEIDECASRSVITLSSQYKQVNSMSSGINSRRRSNNLIRFTHEGRVFMHVNTNGFASLAWKNQHRYSLIGQGYDLYSSGTFRIAYDTQNQQISLRIKPIQAVPDKKDLPQLLSVTYHVFVSGEEMDLYNAMNCEKGKYMYWVKKVQEAAIGEETTLMINRVADLKGLFRGREYVLAIVKAEVMMKWPNNFTEKYRFYYPYQELLLSPFHEEQLSKEQGKKQEEQREGSSLFGIVFMVAAVGIVAVLTLLVLRWLKQRYFRSNSFVSELDQHRRQPIENGTELATKSKQEVVNYAPPQ